MNDTIEFFEGHPLPPTIAVGACDAVRDLWAGRTDNEKRLLVTWAKLLTTTNCGWSEYHIGGRMAERDVHHLRATHGAQREALQAKAPAGRWRAL